MAMDKSDARECVLADWKGEENRIAKQGGAIVYANQKVKALEIQSCFASENISHVTLVASPQWGKTGVALYVMYLMTTLPCDTAMIHPDNTFILSGMSDKDWLGQTKKRMPRIFRDRVFHRNNLHTMIEQLTTVRDAIIVLDECHFGSEVNQTLHTCLKESGIWNIDQMMERNIKILSISATPTNFLLDAREWGSKHHRTIIATGKECQDYVGFHTLLQENRIKTADINIPDDIDKIFATIYERWGDHDPRYHIFRVTDTCIDKTNICGEILMRGYKYHFHNSKSRLDEIDTIMQTPPKKHFFIIIKGFWKAAKTLDDRYVGVCYEATKNDTAATQGLGGRLLGFGKQRGNKAPILYGQLDIYKKYVDFMDKGCDYLQTKRYTSGTLKIRNGEVSKKADSLAFGEEVGVTVKSPSTKAPHPPPPHVSNNDKGERLIPTVAKLKEIPANTKYATTIAVYTPDEFMRTFKVQSIPAQAEGLSKLLNKNGFAARVSFQRNSMASVSNLVNYYKRPEWAKSIYHVVRVDPDGPITVITRDTVMLSSVKQGDFVMAHSAKTGLYQLYKF